MHQSTFPNIQALQIYNCNDRATCIRGFDVYHADSTNFQSKKIVTPVLFWRMDGKGEKTLKNVEIYIFKGYAKGKSCKSLYSFSYPDVRSTGLPA